MCALRKSNTQELDDLATGHLDPTVPLLVSKALRMVNGLTNHIPNRTGAVKEIDEDRRPIYFWFQQLCLHKGLSTS
jgi:hypothetical protein